MNYFTHYILVEYKERQIGGTDTLLIILFKSYV